ncbi:MAG TPA: hypothetical protein VFZ16_19670 [Hyphomicrobiaceae bacterium]|nr:hypothetical protein [Hyphomicrobiaceae bacterium]
MSTRDTSSWIEQLERVRAELEAALAGHSDWRVLRRTTSAATRTALERALAENPVYRAWELLGGVIEAMRTESALSAAGAASALTTSDAGHGRGRRLSLRDVLASIRTDDAEAFDEDPATALVIHDPEPPADEQPPAAEAADQANDGWPPAANETEEATISFVVREPPTRSDPSPQRADIDRPVGAEGADPVTNPVQDTGGEAEVTIVPRCR